MSDILVVDDEFDVSEILCSILEDEGYAVTRCRTGAAGREALARARPDLVLLDVMMPDANGLDMLREMRADPNLRTVPVILISSAAEVPFEPTTGPQVLLRKPFTFQELTAEITALLSRAQKGSDGGRRAA